MDRVTGKQTGNQRGVALITALLVVALAATAATAMARQQQLQIQRSANLLNAEQAWFYVVGVEAFARQVLRRDAEEGEVDHLGESWAHLVPPTGIDAGNLTGQVEDLSGRFDLNSLVVDGGVSSEAVLRFQRLLLALDLPAGQAWNVVDWLDPDQEPSPGGGAEDLEYLRLRPGYRTAGRRMASPSELMLVAGFDAGVYETLAPHVTALPRLSVLNVNTTTGVQFQALSESIDATLAGQLVEARGETGYVSIDDFLDRVGELVGEEARERVAGISLGVKSDYFLFTGHAEFGKGRVQLASLLWRESGGVVRTLRRSRGEL